MRYKEEILPCEGGEALAQVAQRSCGCPLPGRVQGQVGRWEVSLPMAEGWDWMGFKVPPNTNRSVIL